MKKVLSMNGKGKKLRAVTMWVGSCVSEQRTVNELQEISRLVLQRQCFDLLQYIGSNFKIRSFYHGSSYPSFFLSFVSGIRPFLIDKYYIDRL
jgi:hypothetical protein